jgi:hypothetical protein
MLGGETGLSPLQFCTMAIGNASNLGVLQLSIIIAAATIFGMEYTYGTLRYVRIAPASLPSLYAAKLGALSIYAVLLGLSILGFSLAAGYLSWDHTPLSGASGEALSRPGLRVALFYGLTIANQVFPAALGVLAATLARNHTTGLLAGYAVYVLMLVFVPEEFASWTPKAALTLKPFLISETIRYGRLLGVCAISILYAAVASIAAAFVLFPSREEARAI